MGVPSVSEWEARITGQAKPPRPQTDTQVPSYESSIQLSSTSVPSVAEWDARIATGQGRLIHQPGQSAKSFIPASEHEGRIFDAAQSTTVAPQSKPAAPPPYSAVTPITKIGASGDIGASGFPKDFGFYHASDGGTDMVIQLHADNSKQLFYVSCHGGFSSQPSVVLHSGPYNRSAPLASVEFKSFSSTIDILVGQEPVMLQRDGVLSDVRFFDFLIPSTGKKERFEWKHSSGPEVMALKGSSHGMKLVWAAKNEVVAAWAGPNSGTRKKGKMSFMGDREALGPRFEVMAVISVLAIMERKRRTNKKKHHGAMHHMAGSAGGFGGAAGMGGGGC
jgi:hypothetical protein